MVPELQVWPIHSPQPLFKSHAVEMAAVPPPLWQRDTLQSLSQASERSPRRGITNRIDQHPTCEQGAEAYRHVKVVASDARRDFDLHDLLISTRREETYQPYPHGVSEHGCWFLLEQMDMMMKPI